MKFKDDSWCLGCPRYIEAGVLCDNCDYEEEEYEEERDDD